MLALYVPEGTPPTAFLPPGRFKATWTGDLNMRLRERMARMRGRVRTYVAVEGAAYAGGCLVTLAALSLALDRWLGTQFFVLIGVLLLDGARAVMQILYAKDPNADFLVQVEGDGFAVYKRRTPRN